MKRNITKIFAALALLVFLMPTMAGWGQTRDSETITFAELGLENGVQYLDPFGTNISVTFAGGENDGKYYTTGSGIRTYGGGTITITANGNTVTAISTTFSGSSYAPSATSVWSSDGTTSSSTHGVDASWSGSATEIVMTRPTGSGHWRLQAITVTYSSGGTPVETVATPTFSPAAGTYTSAQTVSISCATSGATIHYTIDGTVPTTSSATYSSALTITETTTVKALAVKTGMNNSAVATAEYTINLPYSGPDYVRITDINALADGDRVIIAARYNTNATSYYAMTAVATGKPTGVSFTSTSSNNGEVLPSSILDNESTFYWTVRVTSNGYTFTNAENKVLGYSSSTNFATGGNNTEWTIASGTSFGTAMVQNYQAFVVTNKNNTGRAIALNTSHNYGPYDKGNMTNSNAYQYNFYLDIFVQGYTPVAVASPTFSPEAGTYYGTQSVTISCATANSNIFYTTDGTDPTSASTPYTGAITVSETTTIKAIAYVGTNQSYVASATYTINQPISTIPALYAAATTTETPVYVTFGNWVVSGISTDGKNVFVTDNNGNGFVIYFTSDMSGTFAEGNILSGTAVPCSLKKYNGYADLLNLDANDLTIATGGTVSTADIALASLAGVNTGALVHYEGLTCSVTTNQAGTSTYYNLSDGTTTIQVYNSLYAFEPLEDGAIYNITGIYQQYNSYKEINPRSAADIVKVTTPVINAASTFSMAYNHTAGEIAYTITNPVQDEDLTATTAASWITSISVLSDKVTIHTTENDGQAARTATITLSYEGAEDVDVTVTQGVYTPGASTGGDYVRISSLNQLTDGSVVVIAARYNSNADNYFAMKNTIGQKIEGTEFVSQTSGTNEILASAIVNEIDDYYWTVSVTDDGYTFTNANGDVVGYGGSTNFSSSATGNNVLWNVTRQTSGETLVSNYTGFVIKNKGDESRCVAMRVTNTGKTYGAYSTANMNADTYNFFLDFFVEMAAVSEYTIDIDGYGTGTGKYYLIASPIECVTPLADNGFIQTGDGLAYDLYRFDQGQEDEWLNYKTTPFNLLSGHGYLYASKTDTQLTFTGTPYSGNGQVTLSKVSGASWEGWNLIGNPFGNTAVLKDANNANMAYYKMNGTGTEIITGTLGADIATMEGVFVVAANNGDVVTFVPSNNGKSAQLSVNVNKGMNTIDRAIVRFDNGGMLPKFQLNPNHTKVFFTEGSQDFAVVRSGNDGEMPVSFKAETNGTYTLSADITELEMNYLHLIDNMTGADVDLLATPSYTFDARTTDYASRFKLVFKAGTGIDENTTTATFAFFNGSEWTVSNQGNATLQVVDMTGRVLSNTQINGNATININETAGIYMLRLVNGNNVKVQKVVVR